MDIKIERNGRRNGLSHLIKLPCVMLIGRREMDRKVRIVIREKCINIDGEEVKFEFDKDSYRECHVPENRDYQNLRRLLELNRKVKKKEAITVEFEEYVKLRDELVKKYNLDTEEK